MTETTSSTSSRTAYSLQDLQASIGGEIVGDPQMLIAGVNNLELAKPGELAFAETLRYAAAVQRRRASERAAG